MTEVEWIYKGVDATRASALARETGLPPFLTSLLVIRNVDTPEKVHAFLNPSVKDLPSPHLLPDVDKAVERLITALAENELITIYGDYDADGLTATALLADFLERLGARVGTYIPHRLKEGYGLNVSAVESLARAGTTLLITVDCGISNHEETARAAQLGMDVIITDHHKPLETLPGAVAVINPKRSDSRFPQHDLAGVGVAFFLAGGLRKTMRERGLRLEDEQPELAPYLGLTALGTVADLVPMREINRILACEGLKYLADPPWPGLASLKEVSNLEPGKTVTAEDVGFRLAPRLNAAGRLDSAQKGLDLLMIRDPDQARRLAGELEEFNRARKRIQEKIFRQACALVEESPENGCKFFVLSHEDWHRGVVGIAASKIVETYHRPAVLLALEEGRAVGSGRSIPGFSLFNALNTCRDMLDSFGGHDHAAGLALPIENVPDLAEALERIADRDLSERDLRPTLTIEARVTLDELNQDLINQVYRLEPFGIGNPEPVLAVHGLKVLGVSTVGRNHLKLRLQSGSEMLETIGFGLANRLPDLGPRVSVALKPLTSTFQGRTTRQWQVIDIKKDS